MHLASVRHEGHRDEHLTRAATGFNLNVHHRFQEKTRMTASGASKALRGASNRLAKKLGAKPKHTRWPRQDFDRLLKGMRDPRLIAEYYYTMGLRRGLIRATDYIADGTFELDKDGALRSPHKITVDVRLGLPTVV